MGTKTDDPRCHKVEARLTEKEYLQMTAQMERQDYQSVSRYVRAKILDERQVIRRSVVLTDRNLRDQINALSSRVAKIGVDYNQATRKFNTLSKLTRPDGSPVINARAANYYLSRLYRDTRQLNDAMSRVIEIVERLDRDVKPHSEAETNNNT